MQPGTALSAAPSSHFFPVVVWILSMGCSSHQESLLQHRLLSSGNNAGNRNLPHHGLPTGWRATSASASGASPHPPALTWVPTWIFFPSFFSIIQLSPPLLKRFSQRHPQLSWQALQCPVVRAETIPVWHRAALALSPTASCTHTLSFQRETSLRSWALSLEGIPWRRQTDF